MEGATASGVETSLLAKEGMVLHYMVRQSRYQASPSYASKRTLRTEELAGDVEGFTSHNDDLLAIQQLLGDDTGQATEKVSLAINDDLHGESVIDDFQARLEDAQLDRGRTSWSVTGAKGKYPAK